jgi:hypothetical protein
MRFLTALVLLATVAAASSCSSNDEPASGAPASAEAPGGWKVVPAVSGSRLRARFVAAGDSRELVGFHDSARNEDCTFQPAEEGRTRCLPANVASVQGGGFSDPACQIPLVSLPACPTDVKYSITYRFGDGSGCGSQAPAEIRSVVAGGNRYANGPGGCTLQPASSPLAALAALGEVVPWTEFVAATEATEPITPADSVAEKVLVASDGARQHLGFRIESLDVDCTFQLMPDGVTRCIPEAIAGPVFYTDASCTRPSFVTDYGSSGPCAKPRTRFWLEPSMLSCAAARAIYSLRDGTGGDVAPYDDVYTPTLVSSSTGTGTGSATDSVTCTSTRGGSGAYDARRVIDANVTSSLPTRPHVGSGGGRLVPALVSTPATAANPAPAALALGWHDNDRDADCTFILASDGKLRCLPTGAAATIFFTDAKCSSPSVVAVTGEVSCAGSQRFVRVASATCPVTTRVYAVGTERRDLTSASSETSPGHCPTFAGVTNARDATEVDVADFVEGLPVTE